MEPTMNFSAPLSQVPVQSADTVGAAFDTPVVSTVPNTEYSPEVPVVAPQQEPSFQDVSVYAESISASSSNDPSQAVFDIVLNVSWTCPASGEYKNAKVLKSISFCKASLADQTSGQQVTFVESKQPEVKKDNTKLLNTMRELAGVPGNRTFC